MKKSNVNQKAGVVCLLAWYIVLVRRACAHRAGAAFGAQSSQSVGKPPPPGRATLDTESALAHKSIDYLAIIIIFQVK